MRKSCTFTKLMFVSLWLAASFPLSPIFAADIAATQRALEARGYEVGSVDGLMGPQTRQAIQAFQVDHNLPINGEISEDLEHLLSQPRTLSPIIFQPPDENPLPHSQAMHQTDAPPVPETNTPDQFADRNWLIQDMDRQGEPIGPAFSVYLEHGGSVAGPRFADQMRWQGSTDDDLTLTYENIVGLKIQRFGRLTNQNRLVGHAEASDGAKWKWKWTADAKPNGSGSANFTGQ
jgi:peptidoglycan hydrolase-like protein with peptidoglycan-binding domain